MASDHSIDDKFYVFFIHDEKAKAVKANFNKRKYRVSEGPSSRTLNHWVEQGIIEDGRQEAKGWREFSFSEVAWIEVIVALRKFGVSIQKIKTVNEELLRMKDFKHHISKRVKFDFYLAHSIASKDPCYLLVFDEGSCQLLTQNELDLAKFLGSIPSNHLTIDLGVIARRILNNRGLNKTDYLGTPIAAEEDEVIAALRDKSVKRVEVSLVDGSIVTYSKVIRESPDSKLDAVINAYPFQEVSFKRHRGKTTQIERTEKIIPHARRTNSDKS